MCYSVHLFMYSSFWEFSSKVQLCFGLSPKWSYVSMLLALNCLIPVNIMCTSLFCSSSRLDSGETELPCVWIKLLGSLQMAHAFNYTSAWNSLAFPLLICFLLSLNDMAELLLTLNFVTSPFHLKKKKVQVSIPLPATGWPLFTGKADSLFLFISTCSFLLNFTIYCFKTSMSYHPNPCYPHVCCPCGRGSLGLSWVRNLTLSWLAVMVPLLDSPAT